MSLRLNSPIFCTSVSKSLHHNLEADLEAVRMDRDTCHYLAAEAVAGRWSHVFRPAAKLLLDTAADLLDELLAMPSKRRWGKMLSWLSMAESQALSIFLD